MIRVIEDWNTHANKDLLAQMYRMRARVFGERLKWDVDVVDGVERDHLDEASPVYVVSTDLDGCVNGSCRLLPTTGPTLMAERFADTFPNASQMSDPSIWECTRFCVDDRLCGSSQIGIGSITLGIVRTVIDLAASQGIDTIIANVSAATIRMCRRNDFRIDILGVTKRFSPSVYLVSFEVENCRKALNRTYVQPKETKIKTPSTIVFSTQGERSVSARDVF